MEQDFQRPHIAHMYLHMGMCTPYIYMYIYLMCMYTHTHISLNSLVDYAFKKYLCSLFNHDSDFLCIYALFEIKHMQKWLRRLGQLLSLLRVTCLRSYRICVLCLFLYYPASSSLPSSFQAICSILRALTYIMFLDQNLCIPGSAVHALWKSPCPSSGKAFHNPPLKESCSC